MISPYYLSEKNVIREVAWSFPGETIIEDSEILKDMSLEELRTIFQLSSIHPVTGSYKITEDNAKFFQKKIKHKMDFTKYEYYLLAGS